MSFHIHTTINCAKSKKCIKHLCEKVVILYVWWATWPSSAFFKLLCTDLANKPMSFALPLMKSDADATHYLQNSSSWIFAFEHLKLRLGKLMYISGQSHDDEAVQLFSYGVFGRFCAENIPQNYKCHYSYVCPKIRWSVVASSCLLLLL